MIKCEKKVAKVKNEKGLIDTTPSNKTKLTNFVKFGQIYDKFSLEK